MSADAPHLFAKKRSVSEKALLEEGKALLDFIFQSEVVSDHGDKFRVGGLAAVVLDGVAKIGVEGVHVAAIPSDFDSMADGTLHTGGGGLVLLGYRGIENLGHRVDDVAVLNGHKNGGSQILIALDMRGDADLMNDLGHLRFNVGGLCILDGGAYTTGAITQNGIHMFAQATDVIRLHQAKLRTCVCRLNEGVLVGENREHDERGLFIGREVDLLAVAQNADAVQLGKAKVDEGDVGMGTVDAYQRVLTVGGFLNISIARRSQALLQALALHGIFVGDENFCVAFVIFHYL